MVLGGLLSTASEVAVPVLEAARSLIAAPQDRRAHSSETHTHLETRGMHVPGAENAARALENRLTERDGVRSAEVNAVLGRVVIAHGPEIARDELARVIAEVESDYDLAGTAPGSVHHPGNAGPVVREAGALCLSLAGLGYAAATSLLPVRGFPPSVSAVLSLADSVPWMRATAESALGRPLTDAAFSVGGALSHTLERSPFSLITGSCQRFCSAREAIARQQAWQRWERSAAARPGAHRAEQVPVAARPSRLPDGPVERVANVTGSLALAGYGATLAATGSPRRALAVLAAGVPRAGAAGRSAFASQLVTSLSDRETVVFDPDAFRRLDRVDTVVLDAPLLVTERRSVESLFPLDDTAPLDDTGPLDDAAESGALFTRATELVDPAAPRTRQRDGEWSTAPVSDFPRLRGEARARARAEAGRGADVLVLCHGSRPVALVSVIAELDPFAEALVEAAGAAGRVLIAGRRSRLDRRLPVDGVVPGGNRLAESVRELQSEDAVVAVVSQRARSALAGADLGIGVPTASGAMPWSAHVVCQHRTEVHTLLSTMELARQVSRNSSALCVAGSTLGLLFGWLGPVTGANARASMPVQASALFALGLGTWAGMRAAGRAPPAPRGRTPWHAMPADTVLTMLSSSERGLEHAEAKRRQPPPQHTRAEMGVLGASLSGLANPMTPVLGAGAVVSAGLGSVVDAVMIMAVLVGSAAVDGVHQVRTDRELRRLLESGQLPVRVRRAGSTSTLPADQLVLGDVVELHSGDGVPADCRLLDCDGLEVDESSLTGESQLVAKSERPIAATALGDRTSMLYQGTAVATGRATAVVVATGASTEVGQATQDNGGDGSEPSGVQQRLTTLTRRTLPLSTGAGAILFAVDVLRGTSLGGAVTRAVGLAVAAVPEGLPFVATVAELAAARRLSTRGVLVRSPATIEALGRVDALCFDKTGTLTQGRIALRHVSDGSTVREPERLDAGTHEVLEAAVRASPREDGDRPLPHPTDQAVLDGGRRAGIQADHHPRELLAELAFEPSRGYHAARWNPGDGGGRLSVKGAPEVVLDRCSGWRRPDRWVPFDGPARAAVEDEVERLALAGYRVLAIAERREPQEERPTAHNGGTANLDESEVDGLDLLGLLALADPVHPTAAEAVGRLHRAGVDLMMITGDHPSTAEAIAVELDLLDARRVITGSELDEMDDEQLTAELPKIAVFARVSPAQKARIVRQLRAADRVVAMTGDGANDVPAIRLAQVGIALGSRATPAARESADLVISDDRIETITAAVVEGRAMWASVHDAISILLGGNLGEIAYALGTGLLGGSGALNARQLLVVNLLTDVLPALAIAVRPPPEATPEALLSEGPEASLGSALNRDVYARAAATAGAASLAWLAARPVSTPAQARTAGLVALVSAQLGQTVAMRGRTPMVLVASGASLLVLLGLVQLPGVSEFFGSQPLLLHQWALALGAAGLATAAMLLWQAWFRTTGHPPDGDGELPGPDGANPA